MVSDGHYLCGIVGKVRVYGEREGCDGEGLSEWLNYFK